MSPTIYPLNTGGNLSPGYLFVSLQSPVFQHAVDVSGRSHFSTVATSPDRFSELGSLSRMEEHLE